MDMNASKSKCDNCGKPGRLASESRSRGNGGGKPMASTGSSSGKPGGKPRGKGAGKSAGKGGKPQATGKGYGPPTWQRVLCVAPVRKLLPLHLSYKRLGNRRLRDVHGREIKQLGKQSIVCTFGYDGRNIETEPELVVTQGARKPVLLAGAV